MEDRDRAKTQSEEIRNQKTEAKIGVHVLIRLTELGRPEFQRVV